MTTAILDDLLRVLFAEGGSRGGGGDLHEEAWGALVGVAEELCAGGLLAARLKERGELERVPESVRERLLVSYRDNTAHALMLSHELGGLLDDFERAALAVAPLKGGSLLLAGIHRDLGGRYFNDLDILTRPKDRHRVDALLRARGFVVARSGDGPKHLPPYRRGNIFVEVHEFAYWEASGVRVDLDRWLTQGSTLALTIAHLLHHLFVSSVTEPILALKTLWDFRELSRHPFVPWAEAQRCADRAGLGDELAAMRDAVDRLARGEPIEGAASRIVDLCRPLREGEYAARELEFVSRSLLRAPAWYRAAHALTTVFPTRASMEAIHGFAPGSPWSVPAYALRPVRLAYAAASRAASYSKRRVGGS